jgi:glycosyltransferase involved in cell wall biosynthesis
LVSRHDDSRSPRVACFATQGPGSRDEDRIRSLLAPLDPIVLSFDRSSRAASVKRLLGEIRQANPDVVVMEGTGVGGGAVVIASKILDGRPYVISSGDAVAPFVAAVSRPLGIGASVYERSLCALSAGFIGWSPYLAGRAMTFGAPRAMTAPNWAAPARPDRREELRAKLGIPDEAIVFGIVGSLNWTPRYEYCYGYELVAAAARTDRADVKVLVVGDGDGRQRLVRLAGARLDKSIFLPGAVPRSDVADYLQVFDVASLPQSVDGVGAFRYTTKISEYAEASLPIVTGQIPLAYDLYDGALWRLPGDAPWDDRYIAALAELMTTVTRSEIESRQPPCDCDLFSEERQRRQVTEFILDVVERETSPGA